MEMLPAFALFAGAALEGLATWRPRWMGWVVPMAAALIVANTILLLRAGPLVFQEAVENSRSRIPFESALANWLRVLPPGKTLLMYTSEHIGAVQQAGIPLRDIINEGDYYDWGAALKDPAAKADYVAALDGTLWRRLLPRIRRVWHCCRLSARRASRVRGSILQDRRGRYCSTSPPGCYCPAPRGRHRQPAGGLPHRTRRRRRSTCCGVETGQLQVVREC